MKHSKRKKLKGYFSFELVGKILNIACLIIPVVVVFAIDHEVGNTTILCILLAAGGLFTALFAYISIKTEARKAEMYDAVREGIERDIINLQSRLAKTDKQWNSSNHLVLQIQTMENNGFDPATHELRFLRDLGLNEDDYIIDQTLIFYLSSFSSEYAPIHTTCKETCERLSMKLVRADDIFIAGDIFTQIVKYIVKSTLIIVNIDGKNPNVFYELGIAHALGKNVILISKRDNDVPFDIRQNRIILYSDVEELADILSNAVWQHKKLVQAQLSMHPSNQIASGVFSCPSSSSYENQKEDADLNTERKSTGEDGQADGNGFD